MTPLQIAFFALFAVFAIAGAVSDFRTRKIRNVLNLAFFAVGVVMVMVTVGWSEGVWYLAHFAAAFALGIAIFAIGGWGGGDAKFYAAMAVWFPISQFLNLLISFALVGGVMALLYFATRRSKGENVLGGDKKSREIPYGVALAIGGLLVQVWAVQALIDPATQLRAF
ncbi:A24 family peptidase [Altererythrobacter sp. CAU 1778]